MAATLTTTLNVSGLLYTKTDESTRFLDAIYARGKNGGRTQTNSIEVVMASGYEMLDPTQPNISETASLVAPTPETTERTQEYNVVQIFQRAVQVSYLKQQNRDMLSGVNNANQTNNVPDELDFQIGRRVSQMRMDLNYTLINGVYQYTKGSATVAPRTRGLIPAITTNQFDADGEEISKEIFNEALIEAIKNGANPAQMEIWCNPDMFPKIDDFALTIPGFAQPATRTEGGVAVTSIMTHFGILNVEYDMNIPTGLFILLDMAQMAVAVMPVPYITASGATAFGDLTYEPLAKTGASESGQIYGTLGADYGAEWHHGIIKNIA